MLTRAQDEALVREGYVVISGALDAAWVARLALAFGAAPDRGTQHVAIEETTPAREAWASLRTHPIAAAAARRLLGDEFHVRELHGRAPTPGFGGQGLHADWPARAAGAPCHGVTVLWMIDAFTEDNGATRVVPGTHRLPQAVPRALAQPEARHPDQRLALGPAGSALVLDGHVWHGGTLNRGSRPRRAAQMVIVRGVAP